MILTAFLLSLSSYLFVSFVLFFIPSLLHKSHRYPKIPIFQQALNNLRILNIAHRGGNRHYVQNTKQSFRQGLKHSDCLQMDVCETKDKVLVVHHDHDLQRTCHVNKHIKNLNFDELPSFAKKIQLNFAPLGLTVESREQKISKLQEIFDEFPNVPMNIELKTPTEDAIKQLVALIKKYKRIDNTIVGIRGNMQERLRQHCPQILTFINDKCFWTYFGMFLFGMLPYVYVEEVSMQIPLWTRQFQNWKLQQWGNTFQNRLYFKVLRLLNPLWGIMAYHLRRRGVMTYFWVCNCEDDYERALKYGACGIMTDRPQNLAEFLQKKAIYLGKQQQIKKQE